MTEERKRDIKTIDKHVVEASAKRNLWIVTTDLGVTKDDFTRPGYWSLVAWKFRIYDRLEIRSGDGEFFAEYLIIDCDKNFAKIHELSWVDLKSDNAAMDEACGTEFEYRLRGPRGHSVIRLSDSAVMVEELSSKDQAIAWIIDNKRSISA